MGLELRRQTIGVVETASGPVDQLGRHRPRRGPGRRPGAESEVDVGIAVGGGPAVGRGSVEQPATAAETSFELVE